MPWSIFPKGVSDLPHVLAGPIVRMVTLNKVIIWICLKSNTQSQLELRDVSNTVVAQGGFTTPLKLGDNLYVTTLILGNLNLTSNTKYFYQINLNINGVNKNLNDPGILNTQTDENGITRTVGGIEKITFLKALTPVYEQLPSLITPPSNINDLRFLHASCRKPHGNEVNRTNVDGIYGAYKTLGLHFLNPNLVTRPHQLFLTGDQIYGDDVSDELLYYIMKASNEIIGNYTEPFSPSTTSLMNSLSGLTPGLRKGLNPYTHLTSDADKSQLMYLKEFLTAYIFFWSDSLYPTQNSTAALNGNWPTMYDVYGGMNLPDELTRVFEPERAALTTFLYTLPNARRAFANISTYMVLDDHEITDDLFLNLKWCYRVLGYDGADLQLQNQLNNIDTNSTGSEWGQRIVANGLTAFNVFQLVGNYDLSANNDFTAFKAKLSTVVADPTNLQNWVNLTNEVLPKIIKSNPATFSDVELTSKDYWNFKLDFGLYQVIFLNSRTQRGFIYDAKGENAAQLICWNRVQQQLGQHLSATSAYTFSIVVAPSPIIGYIPAEKGKEFAKEQVGKPVDFMDFEDWENNKKLKEYILETLAISPRTIILSGDVHYGFSCLVNYWNNKAGFTNALEKRSTIIQLTASSLKNEKSEGFFYTAPGTTEVENSWFLNVMYAQDDYEILGWSQNGQHIKKYIPPRINSSLPPKWLPILLSGNKMSPAVHQMTSETILTDKINDPPSWSYRVRSIKDIRTNAVRNTDILASGLYPGTSSHIKEQYGLLHRKRLSVNNHFFVPGRNNIALVSITGFPTTPQIVQEFFYSPAEDAKIQVSNNYGIDYFQMFTRHVIDFDIEPYNSLSQIPNNRPGY